MRGERNVSELKDIKKPLLRGGVGVGFEVLPLALLHFVQGQLFSLCSLQELLDAVASSVGGTLGSEHHVHALDVTR